LSVEGYVFTTSECLPLNSNFARKSVLVIYKDTFSCELRI